MLAAGLLAAGGVAQQVRVVAPIGGVAPGSNAEEDVGVPVEMFENPNLDRYLRRAQAFLDQGKYDATIQVLQDVIEGRTVEFVDTAAPKPAAGGEPPSAKGADAAKVEGDGKVGTGGATDGKPAQKPDAQRKKSLVELSAAQSVFSQDGRIYRPVRRLCHEILARLPSVGIELYRTSYEVAADELLQQALRDGSIASLEQVANRYFITIPAGKAMVILADRLMHEGRYRAAVQVLRDLVEVYPPDNRNKLGVSVIWCRFKMALCMRLAGEVAAAHAAIEDLAKAHPDESLRILGELQPVKDLPQIEVFAREVQAAVAAARGDAGPAWLGPDTESLVPLWQYRFKHPEPYRDPKAGNNEGPVFLREGTQATWMPYANRHGPGTWVAFVPGPGGSATQALFYEHFRLRVADALTGLQLQEGHGTIEVPTPRENHPRVRVAAVDFALLRPVEDEVRRYVILGHGSTTSQSVDVLKSTQLVAYRRDSLERDWTSENWLDGDEGLRDVTFLAAPTVFGERLLLPALRRTAYTLECLDRTTGRPLWHTALHAGGSKFWKAPGAPVAVHGGIAFVITNAGCLAAVDAFAGDLRWIRRYEREDPMRPRTRNKGRPQGEGAQYGVQFLQNDLAGFLPNDLVVRDGLVVMAPCDGSMLLCVDGATGQPVWMLDASLPVQYAPYGQLRMLLGTTATDLFALSDKHLVCIGLQGGLVRWSVELPVWNGPKQSGRGRGTVVGDDVIVPGERELLLYDTSNRRPVRRLPLPSFGDSREPLPGPFHVVSAGPWLAIGYQGGVEVFSSGAALRQLAAAATDPLQRANLLVQARDLPAAEAVLTAWLTSPSMPAERRAGAAGKLLALVRERAMRAARDRDPLAVDMLDVVLPFAQDRTVRLNWHLARLEVCKEADDLRGHEREQQRLYDYMEGKG
jgi:tetratricopeptide (TPR) repeat protein